MKIVATIVVASRPPNGDRLQRRPLMPIEAEETKIRSYLYYTPYYWNILQPLTILKALSRMSLFLKFQ